MPEGCQPRELYQKTEQLLKTKSYLQPNSHPEPKLIGIIKDSVDMTNLFYPTQDKALVLVTLGAHGFPYTTTVLLYTGKGHRLPISNTIEDELAPKIYNRIFQSLDNLKEGEILITLDKSQPLFRFEQTIVNKIEEKWNLCSKKRSPFGVVAYELTRKSVKCHNNS